jgi:hypothetical protein
VPIKGSREAGSRTRPAGGSLPSSGRFAAHDKDPQLGPLVGVDVLSPAAADVRLASSTRAGTRWRCRDRRPRWRRTDHRSGPARSPAGGTRLDSAPDGDILLSDGSRRLMFGVRQGGESSERVRHRRLAPAISTKSMGRLYGLNPTVSTSSGMKFQLVAHSIGKSMPLHLAARDITAGGSQRSLPTVCERAMGVVVCRLSRGSVDNEESRRAGTNESCRGQT